MSTEDWAAYQRGMRAQANASAALICCVAAYDLIFMFSLIHHFDEDTNRELVARCAKALKPGGVLAIGDVLRPSAPGRGDQQAAFFDLYSALTSEAGLWSADEVRSWQAGAGLRLRRTVRVPFGGGLAIQSGTRA